MTAPATLDRPVLAALSALGSEKNDVNYQTHVTSRQDGHLALQPS